MASRRPFNSSVKFDGNCRKMHRIGLVAGSNRFDAPGGGEVQLVETLHALGELGVAARLWQPNRDGLDDVDCLHLFGSHREWLPLIARARSAGKRVALSPIAWFDLASRWQEPASLVRRIRGVSGQLVRIVAPRAPSWRRQLYHAADVLLPNSQAEATQLERYFRVPAKRIRVVPNGADPRLADSSPGPFAERVGGPGFVLAAGRIEPRKNQLGLIRALSGQGVRLVILGSVVPGYESYENACRRSASDNVQFLPAISHDNPLLGSALAACGCLAVPSWFETPGLIALEAAMSGTPLVLTNRGATREYFGPLASYVEPGDLVAIRDAVVQALGRGRDPLLADLARQRYTWQAAARATREAYATLV
jgi:glycosyltransferase involved in cell wall biosynthesis